MLRDTSNVIGGWLPSLDFASVMKATVRVLIFLGLVLAYQSAIKK